MTRHLSSVTLIPSSQGHQGALDQSPFRGGKEVLVSPKSTRRIPLVAFAVVGVLLGTAGSALAQGPPIVNETDHFIDETSTEIDVHPCTGQAAELTIVQSGVIHFTAFADGTVHFTGTLRGTFSADALPTDGIADATGRFVVWFGGNGLLLEEGGAVGRGVGSFTLNGRGTNADGSRFVFHQNGHTVFDTDGVPKLDFFKARCA